MTANTNTTINPPLNAIANAAIVTAEVIRFTVWCGADHRRHGGV